MADALTGKSMDFHLPASANTHWEVERKPYERDRLRLRPNQPVSRAWDCIFRVALSRIEPHGLD